MNLLQPVLAAAALLLTVGTAHGQARTEISGTTCQQLRPSDPPCPVAAPAEPANPAGDLSERTHALVLPTGNLLRQGESQVQLVEFGFYDRVAYGVTDRVELSLGMLVPFAVSAGLRVALVAPTGPFRLVAGATIWKAGSEESSEGLVQGGLTAAYQGDRINVHASVEAAQRLAAEGEVIAGYSVGVLARLSPKLAVSAEIVKVAMENGPSCCDELAVAGIKMMGPSWDFDLGIATPLGENSDEFILPILSASTKL